MKSQCKIFSEYNQWANRRLLNVIEELPEDRLWEDHQAFFGSLMGTLNHLLVADSIWQARLMGQETPAYSLDHILHRTLPGLRQARQDLDAQLVTLVASLPEGRFAQSFTYTNMKGESFTQKFSLVMAHIFNHQTHHRAQAHTLVSQFGLEAPPLDFIYYLRERGE